MDEKQAKNELEKGCKKAEELLENPDKLEEFLQKLERKLKVIPLVGNTTYLGIDKNWEKRYNFYIK